MTDGTPEADDGLRRTSSWRPIARRLDVWELVVVAVGLGTALAQVVRPPQTDPWILAWVAPAALLIAVAIRRRSPFAALGLVLATTVGASFAGAPPLEMWIGTQAILFSVTLTLGRVRAVIPAAATGAILYLATVVLVGDGPMGVSSLGMLSWTIGVWGVAAAVSSQRESIRSWRERAERLRLDRENDIRRTIVVERLRIARDLHDELAHQIAIISMNAGAADVALERDPAAARQSLRHVRDASRRVVSELQQILGVLRTDEPGAAEEVDTDVDRLVAGARESGMQVTATGIDMSVLAPDGRIAAYRALQEGITNARRHGLGAISLSAETEGRCWRLTVRNPAVPDGGDRRPGFGLVGMRERVEQAGGSLRVDRRDAEFVLRLELPIAIEGGR